VAIAGAAGQPHKGYPDAGHFIQEDAGPELAADIAEWIRASPRSPGGVRSVDQSGAHDIRPVVPSARD